MKIIRPMPMTEQALVSSSVAETDYTAYNPASSYTTGQRVMVTTVSNTVTVTIAAPCVLSWTAHGFVGGEKVHLTTTGALPTGLVVNTTYYVTGVTTDTFQLANTAGGVPISTSGTQSGVHTCVLSVHRNYEALRAVSAGVYPYTSIADWLDLGATNRWAMFDGSVTSQTTAATSITLSVQAVGRVDSVALMNLQCSTVTITATDSVAGVVYGPTVYNMSSSAAAINNWYSYFFSPILRKTDMVDVDFPPYNNLLFTIVIADPIDTVAVGAVVVGMSRDLGLVQYGAQLGITDYSYKSRDAFGNYVVLERAYSKRGRFTLWVNAVDVDGIHTTLAAYRATPCVYVGSNEYTSSMIYGFYKDFNIDISYPTISVCSLDIEGLT